MCSLANAVGQKRIRSCQSLKASTSCPCQTTPRSRITRSVAGCRPFTAAAAPFWEGLLSAFN